MNHKHWPPYQLVEDSLEHGAQQKLQRLERLYHVGQNKAWDGRQVLADLIAKHGPPRIDDARRDAALQILSILLWGELAAWAISADLAEQIDDIEAKMAATSQAHDEARHFYVLRDYLRALGHPVPRLGGIGRRLLVSILETPSLVHKLIGMQLLVESNALTIFKALVDADVEPVLRELLPYYEQDEARHVGLGVMYLPRLLERLSPLQTAAAIAFQARAVGMLMSGGFALQEHFKALGLNQREMARHTIRLQDDIVKQMLHDDGEKKPSAIRGLLNPARGLGPRILEFVHPERGRANVGPWHRAALKLWTRGARFADRALA